MCDWPNWQASWSRVARELDGAADFGSPFILLNEATSAAQQLSYSRRWAAARFGDRPPRPRPRTGRDGRRRVGYFSADFKEHAVAHLVVEVLELHDRERFEIFAYSYGPDDGSPMRARLRSAVEHFVDVAWDTDDAIASRMREDELDVLVDLKGHTVGHRLSVMARRPCAVQATWLGYPGTTGADFIDYVIGDPFVIPPGAEAHYSERVLRLPHCYQANDRKREIGQARARAEYGLPERCFVFCCFNQSVKVTPEVFARWMSLLHRVQGSVLWLLEDNRWASANLARAARNAGVTEERVVLAPRVPHAEHLARYRAADVALDTFPYTSHTTASDALWMGCPLVALCGDTFAARVSGSILASCGLPDLMTHDLEQYETLAYRLATDCDLYQQMRSRVADARDTAPLFDSASFTRDLERLYSQISN
jgi:predicted O-linked N-acetylglucosamine transferase (SPINDLY family)